jgi:hypothetical protein
MGRKFIRPTPVLTPLRNNGDQVAVAEALPVLLDVADFEAMDWPL